MGFEVRRILTAHNAQGRSIVGSTSLIASQPGKMQSNIQIANIWINESLPPVLDGPDPTAKPFPMLPSDGGAVFRLLELAPGTEPHMHKTETVDYVVVTQGELTMLLEDGATLTMKPHDVLIQRATIHGWANRSDKPCRFATVVIDASRKR
jgi:quercetin dioxygenase-like cupin family protein